MSTPNAVRPVQSCLRGWFLTLGAASIPYLALASSTIAADITLIESAGSRAPGTPFSFVDLGTPSINRQGQVLFNGSVVSSTSSGLWMYDPGGGVAPVAVVGQQAVGMPTGVTFNFFDYLSNGGNNRGGVIPFNDSARTAFWASTSSGAEGFWVADPLSGVRLIAKKGDLAPGTSATFNRLANTVPAVNDHGDVAFRSTLNVSGDNGVVHRFSDSAGLEFIVKEDSPVPGSSIGQNYFQAGYDGVVLDGGGAVYFKSSLTPPLNSSFSGEGIGVGRPSQPSQLLLQNGNQAAGLSPGALWSSLFPFETAANSAGQIAFASVISGTGVTSGSNDIGLWVGIPDSLSLVVRRGDQVAGMATGVVFDQLYSPEINAHGLVAFRATMRGPGITSSNDEAVWIEMPDRSLRMVAREGQRPPGAPAGVTFGDYGFGVFNDILMNERGQIAFTGEVKGQPTPGNQNENGIWATDLNGNLELIVLSGQPFRTTSGSTRSHGYVQLAGGTGGDEGYGAGLSDNGLVAFRGAFQSSTAVYVSTAATVPEPGTIALLALGLSTIGAYAMRRRAKIGLLGR
jgi:hypothetical protein